MELYSLSELFENLSVFSLCCGSWHERCQRSLIIFISIEFVIETGKDVKCKIWRRRKKKKKEGKKYRTEGHWWEMSKFRLSVSLSLVSVSALWNVTMYHTVCGMLQCITLCVECYNVSCCVAISWWNQQWDGHCYHCISDSYFTCGYNILEEILQV